jgi:hypothetical protein
MRADDMPIVKASDSACKAPPSSTTSTSSGIAGGGGGGGGSLGAVSARESWKDEIQKNKMYRRAEYMAEYIKR